MTRHLPAQFRPFSAGVAAPSVGRAVVTQTTCTCRTTTPSAATASRKVVVARCHDPGVAIVRYRFRAYPTPQQAQMLARTFGCVRVVYNDCLRLRRDAHAAGEKLSDTEVQRRVITLAKQTPQRAWLGEVASVVLSLIHI